MYEINKKSLLLMSLTLALIVGCVVLLTQMYISSGFSSVWGLVLLLCTIFVITLISIVNVQFKQLVQVIRALANGDSSLGVSHDHPMHKYHVQIRKKMQQAKFDAEHKTEFLKTLLVHIDLALIVCENEGQVIESNPAVARLIGKSIRHINELEHIGTMVLSAQQNLRSTVQWRHGETTDTLTMQVSIAHIQGKEYKIITLQSIHGMLLNKEQQAYKRLTQVLTHEVANTITPLASIAQTCETLMPPELSFTDQEHKHDLTLALNTLASRTQYLGDFIASFREVSSLPSPQLAPTNLLDILKGVETLHQQLLNEHNIELLIHNQSQQLVMLDKVQIEQVFINLLINAIDAVTTYSNQSSNLDNQKKHSAKIQLTIAKNEAKQLYVEFSDNGAGIPEHVIDMIFVPFFTTKQQGSGIGLSLSKQIMINHGGDLTYVTRKQGACFRCIFG